MTDINFLLKHAGLPPLQEASDVEIKRALSKVARDAESGLLTEDLWSTLRAILSTVGQPGSKAGKAAAEKAKKLPGTLRTLYKDTEVKGELKLLYRQFNSMLISMDKIMDGTKQVQEKDPEIKKELELFTNLLRRTIDTLQARAGFAVKDPVKEDFEPEELAELFEELLKDEV